MKPTPNVVVMDLDGVLGEYMQHLLTFGANYFGLPRIPLKSSVRNLTQMHHVFGVGRRAYEEMKAEYRREAKAKLPPVDGMPELTRFVSLLGAEVHVATSRPGDTHFLSRDWLNRNGFCYAALSTLSPAANATKYGMLRKVLRPSQVIAVVEDNLGMANDALRRGFPVVYLRNRPYNQGAIPTTMGAAVKVRAGEPADRDYRVQRYESTSDLREMLANAIGNVNRRQL